MRASDDKRERVVRLLGRRFAEGYLSTDTFESRADRAYASRDDRELASLVHDLPPARRWRAALAAIRDRVARLPRRPGVGPLELREPPEESEARPLVIGRNPSCDLVLADPTVSRRHAELRRDGDGWILADLHSSNGTWLNGWRVRRAAIRWGDELMLGEQRLRFVPGGLPATQDWRRRPERPLGA